MPRSNPDNEPLFCARCSVELHPGRGDSYRVTIEAVADPAPPVLTSEDSSAMVRRQIEQLLEELANVSEREALDQVYRRLIIHFCTPCYRHWIENPVGSPSLEG